MKEQPEAGIPSPVAPAEVKVPTVKRPFEERAPAAQTQVPDKPANEQIASLAKKPTEISTKQKSLPLEPADVKAPEVMPAPEQPAPAAQAQVPGKPANEQIALLTKKPAEVIPEKKPLPRPAPRALEGYIIQLSFSERGEAQRWAENLTAQGYAVSMTEAGTNAFRVRIGNFAVRPEAERRLKTLGQQGLKGIVLNLPQAYRPDTSRSEEANEDAISVTP
jgi:cell division septation protein DedD